MKNKSIYFAASLNETILLILVCVAIFFATNTALNAANYRLSISNNCCTARSVIVSFKTEKDSLSLFRYFNFSFMNETMKDASKAQGAFTNTSDYDSVNFPHSNFFKAYQLWIRK